MAESIVRHHPIPKPEDIIAAVESYYGAKVVITAERTRNEGLAADMQSVVVWLLRSVLGFSYYDAADCLLKDASALEYSTRRLQKHPELLEAAKEIHTDLLSRDVDPIEFARLLRAIPAAQKRKVVDYFLIQMVIYQLSLEPVDQDVFDEIDQIVRSHRGTKSHEVTSVC